MKHKSNIFKTLTKQGCQTTFALFVLIINSLPAYCGQGVTIKQTALKFILAMGGVILSSLIIYVGLTVYNKLFHGTAKRKNEQTDTLMTPNSLEDAIDFFITKNQLK